MAVAGYGIGAARGFDSNLGPQHSGRNVHGGNLRGGNALVVAAEPPRLHTAHTQGADHEASRKQEVSLRQAAGGEGFGLWVGRGGGVRYTPSRPPFSQPP